MNTTQVGELLSANLTSIYGFAFARLHDKEKVDDLASEIVCTIMHLGICLEGCRKHLKKVYSHRTNHEKPC
ncbi:MAG: hypothetical protein KH354_06865 [Clostridiales bacterium]|nr:hypothetical protein [Clostridiales bacterium]